MDDISRENWQRYQYGRDRGHDSYVQAARKLEGMYMGGGLQWSHEDKETLKSQRRMPIEHNEIMPAVNSALGYQIANRMDIAFNPVGGNADQELAEVRSKVAKHIANNNALHWQETQVCADGFVEQRGYYDIRMDYSDNILGEMRIEAIDPRDVIPDPDAKDYDPDKWADVLITRWMSLDDIEAWYGQKARKEVESNMPSDTDFGDGDDSGFRNKFGRENRGGYDYDSWRNDEGMARVRVVDRQKFVYQMSKVAISPEMDIRMCEGKTPEELAELEAQGWFLTKRMMRRVKWQVSTEMVTLFNDYSPFPFLSVVPYFPFFRRGMTRGIVDNGVGPQEALNKLLAQYIHIINTTANSGWMVEENSLTNMDTDDLEDVGAKTGLVVEFRQGSTPPSKIQPNRVPEGVDRMIERSVQAVRDATVPESMRGMGKDDVGLVVQSKQFAAQQQLAVPLDNLARTRNILGKRIDWVITNFYDSQRIYRITEQDPTTGKPYTEEIQINQPSQNGYLNDMTAGEYDVVITSQPMQVTFDNSQFNQVIEMRDKGINIPDAFVLRYSNLSDKEEIIQALGEQQAPQDPLAEAKAALMKAQTDKLQAETVNKRVESTYSATQSAQNIASIPGLAGSADALLKSAGYQDQDAAPIIAEPGIYVPEPEANTNPLTPTNPDVGMNEGIETPL